MSFQEKIKKIQFIHAYAKNMSIHEFWRKCNKPYWLMWVVNSMPEYFENLNPDTYDKIIGKAFGYADHTKRSVIDAAITVGWCIKKNKRIEPSYGFEDIYAELASSHAKGPNAIRMSDFIRKTIKLKGE